MRDDRNMDVVRRSITEELLQPDLPGRRVHDVDAAHDFCNTFELVIDNDSKLIGDQAVASFDDEVAGFRLQSLGLLSLETVFETDGRVIGTDSDGRLSLVAAISAGSRVDCAQWAAGCIRKVLP